MMTARELQQNIGHTADYLGDKIATRVFIRDARVRFGEVDYLIEPVCGYGETWVAHYRVKHISKPTAGELGLKS